MLYVRLKLDSKNLFLIVGSVKMLENTNTHNYLIEWV